MSISFVKYQALAHAKGVTEEDEVYMRQIPEDIMIWFGNWAKCNKRKLDIIGAWEWWERIKPWIESDMKAVKYYEVLRQKFITGNITDEGETPFQITAFFKLYPHIKGMCLQNEKNEHRIYNYLKHYYFTQFMEANKPKVFGVSDQRQVGIIKASKIFCHVSAQKYEPKDEVVFKAKTDKGQEDICTAKILNSKEIHLDDISQVEFIAVFGIDKDSAKAKILAILKQKGNDAINPVMYYYLLRKE